jgi:YggT family protein
MGVAIAWLINTIIGLLIFLIIAQAILSWLIAFNVVNVRNPFVRQVAQFLERITYPLLRPIRRFVPPLGGVDITPIILLLLLQFLRIVLNRSVFPHLIAALG